MLVMKLGINPNYKHLANLGLGLNQSYLVKRELDELERVNNGNIAKHTFAGDDWCIVIYEKEKSTIVNGMDSFEPFEMESQLIYKFLLDWFNFLKSYEDNKIPGLIANNQKN